MRVPSSKNLAAEIKKLWNKMDYYLKRVQEEFISEDEYLQKIRPLTRDFNILEMIQAICISKENLTALSKSYMNLYNIGAGEDYYIRLYNSGTDPEKLEREMASFEQILSEVKLLIESQTNELNISMKRLKLEDMLQDIINGGKH